MLEEGIEMEKKKATGTSSIISTTMKGFKGFDPDLKCRDGEFVEAVDE